MGVILLDTSFRLFENGFLSQELFISKFWKCREHGPFQK